jgi:hypothetical protein
LAVLGTGLATSVESRIRQSSGKKKPSLLEHDGIVRLRLVPRPHPACERFDAYLKEWASVASIGRLTPQEVFWDGTLPIDLWHGVENVCPDWEFIDEMTAPLLLTERHDSKPSFFWTYLYEERLELRSIHDDSLVASYATYQYHPWFNTKVFEGPRLFMFRCPQPTADRPWKPGFWPSQFFIELFRHQNNRGMSK